MNKALFVYITLAALTLVVFAIWPGLDLAGARYFYHDGGFFGRDDLGRFCRDFFRVTPFVVLATYAALWLAKGLGFRLRWAPSGRAMIFLIATMVIGPGLIVNLGFKDHWHRPRPIQTQDFNGPDPFTPWYDDDGACEKNCSFVSGEASTGFWMVAPASVLPPPWRGPAIVAAFAFGFGAESLAARLRRPLPQRRAAGRADYPHRHRGRPPADVAARRLRTGVAPAARDPGLSTPGRIQRPRSKPLSRAPVCPGRMRR